MRQSRGRKAAAKWVQPWIRASRAPRLAWLLSLRGIMRAHLLLALLPMMPVAAEALELTGRYGYAGEWALTATLAEAEPSASGRKRDFAGPAALKHLAICGPGEVTEKSGTLSLRRNGQRYAAMLVIGEDSCAVTGTLSEDGVAFADCRKAGKIPLRLWLK